VPLSEFHDELAKLLARVKGLVAKGEIVLAPTIENASAETILSEALRAFAGYHSHEVISRRGTNLVLADTRLLFYYQNRLAAHGLGADLIGPGTKPLGTGGGGKSAPGSTSLPSHA
jgi:glycerol-3-phosphate O-acyltransferase